MYIVFLFQVFACAFLSFIYFCFYGQECYISIVDSFMFFLSETTSNRYKRMAADVFRKF